MTLTTSSVQQILAATALVATSVLSSGCAPGFETNPACLVGGCTNSTSGTNPSTGSGWDSISLDGSINGGRFDRAKVVDLDKNAKVLVVRLPFIPGIALPGMPPAPLDGIEGGTIGIEPNPDGSTMLVVRIPLAKFLHGVGFLPPSKLPNGDPLPAIPNGELPSLGLTFDRSNNLKGALYLAPSVVGIFVNSKFDPFIRLTLPIRDQARTVTYGYFSTIPAKPGFDGGFFMSFALPDAIARAIDDLL